ncbi:amino acid permease C-terminal domain-containing protein [Microbacterium sp. 5K110]|uniref:amino acid permease C-terminal domain-containing protein n=1 Tax=Microbacterium sp. 5K110 TaxID=2578104 RepID=UPI0010FE5C33|nr:amino acid permease C-terminal domain-containing protein [Microbacterium sp. 5K110]TLF32345.1 hypothetical protein FE256_05765 [Microbacterium sp. 5K110]
MSLFRTKSVEQSIDDTDHGQGWVATVISAGAVAGLTPAVIVLRRTRPDLARGFRVPLNPVLPILSALICTSLMLNLSVETWLRLLIWLALGFAVYIAYSRRHARVSTGAMLDPSKPRVVGPPGE